MKIMTTIASTKTMIRGNPVIIIQVSLKVTGQLGAEGSFRFRRQTAVILIQIGNPQFRQFINIRQAGFSNRYHASVLPQISMLVRGI